MVRRCSTPLLGRAVLVPPADVEVAVVRMLRLRRVMPVGNLAQARERIPVLALITWGTSRSRSIALPPGSKLFTTTWDNPTMKDSSLDAR